MNSYNLSLSFIFKCANKVKEEEEEAKIAFIYSIYYL